MTEPPQHGRGRRRRRRGWAAWAAGWPAWLRWLWPASLAGRIMVVLVALLVIGQILGYAIFHRDEPGPFEVFADASAQQIAGILKSLEPLPPYKRRELLPALSGPLLRVVLPPYLPRGREPPDFVADEVIDYLRPHKVRPVRLYWWRRDAEGSLPPMLRPRADRPALVPSRHVLGIASRLGDGNIVLFALVAEMPGGPRGPGGRPRPLVMLTVVGLLVLGFGWWATHRLTRPLRQLAAAADRLGIDVQAEPLEERGSREMRRTARAFNRMQGRLRRLVEDRTLMLAAISHDLRTALTRLRLRAEFIEDAEQQAKALADLDEMQGMLEATLSFAREDALREASGRLDLAALLQSLVDDIVDAGGTARYTGPERFAVLGRAVALKRAIENLAQNALRYGGEADVHLSARDETITVAIGDRGPGIPPDQRERVFDAFHRLETSRSRETGGTGLGLAVARSIARAHGGDIVFAERDGGGLWARLTLPLVRPEMD